MNISIETFCPLFKCCCPGKQFYLLALLKLLVYLVEILQENIYGKIIYNRMVNDKEKTTRALCTQVKVSYLHNWSLGEINPLLETLYPTFNLDFLFLLGSSREINPGHRKILIRKNQELSPCASFSFKA